MIAASVLEAINQSCEARVGPGMAAPPEIVSTGLASLDAITGGGIPKGCVVEIHGGEGSGKTALALHLAQRLGGPVLYADADHGLNPYILGGRELYLMDAGSLENTLDACWPAAAGGFAAVVLDSVTALPTNEDLRNSINGIFVPRDRQAQVMSKALRVLAGHLHNTGCTLILVDQMRNVPGVVYGRPDRPAGGRAIGYFAALRLETRLVRLVKSTPGEIIGQEMSVIVHKCKYAPPGGRASVNLIWGKGLTL